MKRFTAAIVIGVAAWLAGWTASADPVYVINLTSSGSFSVEQGLSTTVTISASNAGVSAISLGSLQLGIQLVPQGVTTGDVNVVTGTGFAAPATNSPWTDPSASGPTFETLTSGTINGTTDYYLMSITENDVFGTMQPGEALNLGTISFTTTNDALGTWLLFVVNETDFVTDNPLTSITTEGFETVQFANLVAPAGGNPGVSFQAAAITVVAPVPEPGSVAFLASGLASVALAAYRRRFRA